MRRITPTEVGIETDLDACKLDLLDADDDTRGYAAQCLVEHYLAENMLNEAEVLIESEDMTIRSHAEAAERYFSYNKNLKQQDRN